MRRGVWSAFLEPWLHHFRTPDEEVDAWMNVPSHLRPLTESTPGSEPVVLPFTVDPEAKEILVDCRDAPLSPIGWHVARVWLNVPSSAKTAEVRIGEYMVGWTALPVGKADAPTGDERVPTGTLEVRIDGDEIEIGQLECFVLRDSD